MKSFEFKKNQYLNKRCFILGCGPSLNNYPLDKLSNEYTIGVNLIMNSGFTPDLLVVGDQLMLHDNIDMIYPEEGRPKFYVLRNILTKRNAFLKDIPNVHFVVGKQKTDLVDENLFFFNETGNGVICDLAIPTAIYLGFKEIYLLGVDGTHGRNSHFYDHQNIDPDNYIESIVREDENSTSYTDLVKVLPKYDIKLYSCNTDPLCTPEIEKVEFDEVLQ